MDNRVINMANAINNRKMREQREQDKKDAEARVRYLAGRRRDARSRGYRGPLTREEASKRALAALQD